MTIIYGQNQNKVCRICGAAVSNGRKICECCEESFALCDMEDYLNRNSVDANMENCGQTLLKNGELW